MWHSLRNVWTCPTTNDIRAAIHHQEGPLAWFLFPSSFSSRVSNEDACPYCSKLAEDILDDADEDIDDCYADWEFRVEHLEEKHSFGTCNTELLFYREDLFILHLANCHRLKVTKFIGDVVASCSRRSMTAAEILGVSTFKDGDCESL